MRIGMLLPEAGQQATRENIVHAARQAEEERFDSLWVWERLIYPLKPQTPYPATPDGSLPACALLTVVHLLMFLTFLSTCIANIRTQATNLFYILTIH
jgi:alkanesulfonate monooxygenase SsuD/methylene tetrahydromethanopterin reductase-like flavin-dependent oxidoreductase (luciferase family)